MASEGGAAERIEEVPIYPGNVAKYRLIQDVRAALERRTNAEVLDVGCVGPGRPFELWRVLLGEGTQRFQLTGIDVTGIERALEWIRDGRLEGRIEVERGSAYGLGKCLAGRRFDCVVSTQVLEHLAGYRRFLRSLPGILKPGGEVFLTCDSAHFQGKYPYRLPTVCAKRLAKKLLAWIGKEEHYDIPLYSEDVETCFRDVGLEVITRRYFNLDSVKEFHNHVIAAERRDRFLDAWWQLEETINESARFAPEHTKAFRCLYYHLRLAESGTKIGV